MRATFAVGRVRGSVRRVLWLATADRRVFPGPWRVTAVVSDDAPVVTGAPLARDVSPGDGGPSRPAGDPETPAPAVQPASPPSPRPPDGDAQLSLL